VLLADAPQDFAEAEGFLLVGSAGWTERRQALLVEALRHNPRPVLVANPDIVAPRETGFSAEPGHFAHRLADQTGLTPRFFGKPFANIYELAFARLGAVDRDRVLMVGDSLHTDVLGAQAAGIASALVAEFGFFAEGGAEEAIARCGIAPDFVIDRP
jgi:ribonucleotide monophosphatase NagD (HAD superfamily)